MRDRVNVCVAGEHRCARNAETQNEETLNEETLGPQTLRTGGPGSDISGRHRAARPFYAVEARPNGGSNRPGYARPPRDAGWAPSEIEQIGEP